MNVMNKEGNLLMGAPPLTFCLFIICTWKSRIGICVVPNNLYSIFTLESIWYKWISELWITMHIRIVNTCECYYMYSTPLVYWCSCKYCQWYFRCTGQTQTWVLHRSLFYITRHVSKRRQNRLQIVMLHRTSANTHDQFFGYFHRYALFYKFRILWCAHSDHDCHQGLAAASALRYSSTACRMAMFGNICWGVRGARVIGSTCLTANACSMALRS